ncbi:unnamed protein product, partial [Hermetia illucens]
AGLFPLLSYAAMNVRPTLLAIYEKYFVPLGEKLRPALSGFLSGVLPGYESGLDHFERTNSLLTHVCTAVTPSFFYTCLWECVAKNASIRLPAISYLLDHFNKRLGMQEQLYIMGHNHEVMMCGLCACLNDAVILVQRNTLEFLLLGFPMHTKYLNELDLTKLVTNGLNTILRRDMSLNRRLYSWLLGTEVAKTGQLEMDEKSENYFEKYSKNILIKALICTLSLSLNNTPVDLKPYRILVSLLDKAEIGPVVLDYVLCDVIRTMSLANGNMEVTKSANLLFATFDPAYIWNFMTIMFEKSCKAANEPSSKLSRNIRGTFQQQLSSSGSSSHKFQSVVGCGDPGLIEICYLTEFLLETISLEMYTETTRVYLPKVFLAITQMLTIHSENMTHEEVTASLKLCMKIVSRVQPMITSPVKVAKVSTKKQHAEEAINTISNKNSNVSGGDSGSALEKSKSDSKLNQCLFDDEPIRRSNSNQFIDKKSPKKTKKAKSYSKLLELDKEIAPDTGQPTIPSSSSDLDTPTNVKKLKHKKTSPYMKLKSSPKREHKNKRSSDHSKQSEPHSPDSSSLPPLTPETPTSRADGGENGSEIDDEIKEVTVPQRETSMQEYSILEKCIKQYEIFFEVYLTRHVLQINLPQFISSCSITVSRVSDSSSPDELNNIFENEAVYENGCIERLREIDKLFDTLKINLVSRTAQLHSLLNKSIVAESTSDLSDLEFKDCVSSTERLDSCEPRIRQFDDSVEKAVGKLMSLKLNEQARNCIKLASNLLVEMSTFPNYNQNLVLHHGDLDIPSWLKVLTLVSCYTRNDKELQLASISTLFDLISLLKSQLEHSTSPGVTFVVMLPLLKFGHVSYIEHKTRIFQLICSVLWDYLGDPTLDPMQTSSLLYQLHNCLESGLVETVIGNRMSNAHKQFCDDDLVSYYSENNTGGLKRRLPSYKLERLGDIRVMCTEPTTIACNVQLSETESKSFKKFELLWHLGRDKQFSKGFEKTLLRVLDILSLPYYISVRTFVTKWLQESLLRGDLDRVLKPLNKILLSSNTKRIGVVHAHLIRKDMDESQSDTALSRDIDDEMDTISDRDVYAISSEFGTVKYHMDTTHNKKRSPIRSLQKKFFGVTLGNKNKTSNFVSDKTASLTESDSNIGLIINPLDLSSDVEAGDSELGSLSSSAPNKIESTQPTMEDSEKDRHEDTAQHEFCSSCDSDQSSTETESERRENSIEKEIISTSNDIKRFVGDCERVSEVLSEHDRTKNRKTYHLNRASNGTTDKQELSSLEGNGSLASTQTFEESHPADEYFSSSSSTETVEHFVSDLIEQAAEKCDKKLKSKSPLPAKIKNVLKETKKNSNYSNSENESEVFDEKPKTEENISNKEELDARKKSLSLLDKEALEKSKQNVEILRQNVSMDGNGKKYLKRKISEERKRHYDKLHPFHTHMLLYFDVYDTKQTLYAFQTLRNIIACDTRTFLCLSITTSIPNDTLKHLLIRHRKSIFGKGFSGSILNTEFSQNYRGCMYLEALVTICLYYARSFFQKNSNEMNKLPNSADIEGNCKVQLASIELLTLICIELIEIVRGMGKGLACYIADLMAKCKMQKIILHCVNSSVLAFSPTKSQTLTEQILAFNSPGDENLHAETLQVELLRLLMAVIKLEYEVKLLKSDESTAGKSGADGNVPAANTNSNSPTRLTSGVINVKYLPNSLISQQPMFLAAVLSALQADHLRHLHRNWTDLVTSSLNCFSFGSLANIVISVVHQLCNNIDKISGLTLKQQCNFPPDYVVSLLESITTLCHYCLLDNTQQTTLSHLFSQAYPQTSASVQSSNTGQLLNNIVHSFLSSQSSTESQTKNPQQLAARNAVLSHLARIVASVAAIWDSDLGQVRQVKQQLMEFLSPISLHHGANFLAAVSVTWQERGDIYRREQERKQNERKNSSSDQNVKNYLPHASTEQLSLVKLVSSIRVMPMDSFVQTLHQVVKSPPPIHHPPAGLSVEVSALELFYFYMKSAPAPQLADSWSPLLTLLRDGISLPPPAQFVLLMLLNEFVQRCPQMPFQDKKDLKDLHDVTSRLVEALSNVAGACLEQTTWLRRNLAVKEDISPATPDGSVRDLTGNQQYCVQAQSMLAAVLANLLDVAYGSQEKDKVVTIITTLMYNITPYLKNHTIRNIPSFYACSNLLASLSGYQYTRKAWRKDVLDLLLDPSFFQMDISCLPFWKQILDSLMTYDNTTFRELMSRISLAQTGSLNIFASREQEYEQRAMLLKRLAFVIFCSELDQYHKYMPEILEQLANSLRLPSVVPSVQAAVFLFFRVLLLRMSPDHVTSLWPIIIAEMVQVFLAIEEELKTESDELSQLRLSGIDVSWSVNTGNGISSLNHLACWRNVQLEASKLLELGCVLPATNLPHFQMYRWAFVGTEFDAPEEKIVTNGHMEEVQLYSCSGYVPHVRRIARLMDLKYAVHSPKSENKKGTHLVLTCQQITSLQDLYGFFSTLSVMSASPMNFADCDKEVANCLAEIESVLASDFLEKMTSTSR